MPTLGFLEPLWAIVNSLEVSIYCSQSMKHFFDTANINLGIWEIFIFLYNSLLFFYYNQEFLAFTRSVFGIQPIFN